MIFLEALATPTKDYYSFLLQVVSLISYQPPLPYAQHWQNSLQLANPDNHHHLKLKLA